MTSPTLSKAIFMKKKKKKIDGMPATVAPNTLPASPETKSTPQVVVGEENKRIEILNAQLAELKVRIDKLKKRST
jgi:uncharacterized protein YceH (UPF0502 family)